MTLIQSVRCRELFNPDKRCSECANWIREKVLAAYRYQCSLRRRRDAQAKQRRKGVLSSLGDLPSWPSVTSAFGFLLSVEVIPLTETRVSTPHVFPAQSDVLGCSEVSFRDDSLFRDELSAEDSAS